MPAGVRGADVAGRLRGGHHRGRGQDVGGIEWADVAEEAGIDVVNVSGDPRRWYIPESNGNGAAWLDYDGDGDQDLFVANGAELEYVDGGRRLVVHHTASSRLYRNDGELRFTDVTEEAGAGRSEWGQAVATGDVDRDGDPDLYLGCFGRDVLLRNDGGVFVDATEASGLGNELWAAGAAFGDLDRDGHLDLYVANYCLFDPEHPPLEGRRNVIDGVEIGWGPEEENGQGLNPGAPDVFYYGDGRGGFREATEAAGLALEDPLCSYAVVFSDVDSDGLAGHPGGQRPAADCNLFHEQARRGGHAPLRGRGGRRAASPSTAEGQAPPAAMGLAVEDVDGDGDFRTCLRTNFDFEAELAARQRRDRAASCEHAPRRARAGGSPAWTGSAGPPAFFDVGLRRRPGPGLVANGHVYPQVARSNSAWHPWAPAAASSSRPSAARHGWLRLPPRSCPGPTATRAWPCAALGPRAWPSPTRTTTATWTPC